MVEFLNSNPIIALAVAVVVVFILMFVFVKPGKKKTKKTTNQEKSDKKETSQQKTEQGQSEEKSKTDESVEKQQSDEGEVVVKKKVKKAKQKPEISQVYQRTSSKDSENNDKQEEVAVIDVDDIEKRAQFVKTSNKVSKFVGFSDVVEKELKMVEELSEMPVSDFDENCELCENKQKHFDHSRRLSKMVQEESFDDMLSAHISDRYLNINVDKHLNLSEDFSEKLFDRALKTLTNSRAKVVVDELGQNTESEKIRADKDYMKDWLADRRREELAKIMVVNDKINEDELSDEFIDAVKHDIDLSPKNIIVVDSIINRKGKRFKKI